MSYPAGSGEDLFTYMQPRDEVPRSFDSRVEDILVIYIDGIESQYSQALAHGNSIPEHVLSVIVVVVRATRISDICPSEISTLLGVIRRNIDTKLGFEAKPSASSIAHAATHVCSNDSHLDCRSVSMSQMHTCRQRLCSLPSATRVPDGPAWARSYGAGSHRSYIMIPPRMAGTYYTRSIDIFPRHVDRSVYS